MNLLYGEIVEIKSEDGMRMGKIRVGGAVKKAALDFLNDIPCGDRVLLCDGGGISKVKNENHPQNVPRHSR